MQDQNIMNYYTSVIITILLALIVLSILVSENDRIPHKKRQLFIATNILISIAAIAECAGVHINGKEYIPGGVLAAVKAVDYTLTPMAGGALIALMQKENAKKQLLPLLFIGNAIFQIISAFQGWMIIIDNHHHYTHGPLYPIYEAFYILIIVDLFIKMVSYGKSFRKQNTTSLYATILLVFIGIAMQELSGNYRVAYLALTFGSAFLFIHYNEFSQIRMEDEITEQQVIIFRDALTGVFSRFAYNDAVKESIPKDFVAFLFDINGLKTVNDSIGHEAGDELIRGAAECIEATFGKNGRVFRIGGDEFAVFATMPHEQVEIALTNLKQKTDNWSGKKVKKLSLSAGYALAWEHEGFSMEELVKEADRAMYEQKKEYYQKIGRDRRGNTINCK